jgi:hypothetical protein
MGSQEHTTSQMNTQISHSLQASTATPNVSVNCAPAPVLLRQCVPHRRRRILQAVAQRMARAAPTRAACRRHGRAPTLNGTEAGVCLSRAECALHGGDPVPLDACIVDGQFMIQCCLNHTFVSPPTTATSARRQLIRRRLRARLQVSDLSSSDIDRC